MKTKLRPPPAVHFSKKGQTVKRIPQRGETGYVHPFILEVIDKILARVHYNVEHDRDLRADATPYATCVTLGVEPENMRKYMKDELTQQNQDDEQLTRND